MNKTGVEEIFGLLVGAVDEYAIFALDPDGRIVTWNQGAQRLKGYSAQEIVGHHFSRFYTKPDIDRDHPAHELKLAAQNGKYEEEGWRVRKDGSTFWANVVITALREPSGNLRGFAKVTRDLTERKKAEEALREANADLENKIKIRTTELERALRARDEFFSMASHELKTPLASLKMQAQTRLRRLAKNGVADFDADKLEQLFKTDDRQIGRLTQLVDRMLDISRVASGGVELECEPFDMADSAADLIKRLEPILKQSENEVILNSSGRTQGSWDRVRIEQVLTNLLTNAGKYAPAQPVEVSVEGDEGIVRVIVRDHGPGVPESEQKRIFEPFERVKKFSEVGGLGLGLYITRRIVEAHAGSVRVESPEGGGCAFIVELPIAPC